MDYQDLYNHVRQVFDTNWTEKETTPYYFANEAEAEPPKPIKDRTAAGYPARWIDIEILIGAAQLDTYDSSEATGFLRLTFWVEPGAGEKKLFDLLDQVRAIFAVNNSGDVAGQVTFLEPVLQDAVFIEEFPYYGRECLVPFTHFQDR